MKVLIIKLSSIGDVVHTLPSLAALRKGLAKKGGKRNLRIDWLVEEAASGVITGHPLIDNVIVVKRGWAANFKENMATARLLAKERYDLVIDFQGLLKSGVWVKFSRGGRRAGFANGREGSPMFLTEKAPAYDPDKHAVERYLDLAEFCGGDRAVNTTPIIDIRKDAKDGITKKLRARGIDRGEPFFVLVTRSRWPTKLWNDAKFILLADELTSTQKMRPVLVGGAPDKKELEAMKERIKGGAVTLAGETDLAELAALFNLSSLVVTLDSGPMHIAAAADAKVVALFGPTAPQRTGPYTSKSVIVRRGLDCSPCFKRRCADVLCMTGITVEEVKAAALNLLNDKKREEE